jgi:gamma-glutamyltranspeptidase/glutathione hydrolase
MRHDQLNWASSYPSFRKPMFGANVVATSQPLAAQAGMSMLQKGGNAVDAALATAICLAVVEPTMNGIGSDSFALVWDGSKVHGFNASGRSPAAWTPEVFQGLSQMPTTGWGCVTVPGAVSGWIELSRKFGVLPFAELFKPAIEYATSGYLVSPVTARTWQLESEKYREFDSYVETFLPKGRAPGVGELFKCPQMAETLAEIADTYGESFYRGRLARLIAGHARATGGLMTEEDLASHEPEWVEPLKLDFGDYSLYEIPPNSHAIAALLALGILRNTDVVSLDPDSVESVDIQARAMAEAVRLVQAELADPAWMRLEPSALLDEEWFAARAGEFASRAPDVPVDRHMGPEPDTVFMTAADSSGMMVSLIQSNYFDFGSGIVIPGTGISMHSRGALFSLESGHPNQVAGRKRPFHTLCPGFVTHNGEPAMSLGVIGGPLQPQAHVQMFLRVCALRQNPQAACDAPRWFVTAEGPVMLEGGLYESVGSQLRHRGHVVERGDYGDPMFGGAQAICKLESGYCAASDPRRDGEAVVW